LDKIVAIATMLERYALKVEISNKWSPLAGSQITTYSSKLNAREGI